MHELAKAHTLADGSWHDAGGQHYVCLRRGGELSMLLWLVRDADGERRCVLCTAAAADGGLRGDAVSAEILGDDDSIGACEPWGVVAFRVTDADRAVLAWRHREGACGEVRLTRLGG